MTNKECKKFYREVHEKARQIRIDELKICYKISKKDAKKRLKIIEKVHPYFVLQVELEILKILTRTIR